MILDDVAQGIALYRLSTSERVRTFPVPSSQRRSRNVAFHDGGSALVSGSDHGNVYIFDRRTGDILDTINMGVKDWVQSVTTTEMAGIPTIILGQSGFHENTKETLIQVWHKRSMPVADVSRSAVVAQGPWVLCTFLAILFILEHILV
ncbi:hypothetical protein HHX47_DHR1001263 [Lentinula edodes]|nr:hypothetical protein HHX47_DHR1001263 [Lentinula edodes]